MSITSGFFNSIDGDRLYNARDMSMYFNGLISDGVYASVGGALKVTAGAGMSVNVAEGRAIIDSQWLNSDAIETLSIDAADVGKKRKDAITLRLDLNEDARNITLYVKKGTATTGTPAPPARTWSESVKELYLAYVTVSATTTAIGTSAITDMRGTSVCPYVTGIVEQVDTAALFEQSQAACEEFYTEMTRQFIDYFTQRKNEFDAFMSTLTGELKVDTSIAKYEHYDVYKSDTGYIDSISMPLAEYKSSDVTLIHVGGVLLVEGVEYIVGGGVGTGATITFPNRLRDNGDGVPITVIVFKGANETAVEENVILLNTSGDNVVYQNGLTGFEQTSNNIVGGVTEETYNNAAFLHLTKSYAMSASEDGYLDAITIRSNEQIDLTEYSKIAIRSIGFTDGVNEDRVTCTAYFKAGDTEAPAANTAYNWDGWQQILSTQLGGNVSGNITSSDVFTYRFFDISDINGLQYLNFGLYHGAEQKAYSVHFCINEIYLIK